MSSSCKLYVQCTLQVAWLGFGPFDNTYSMTICCYHSSKISFVVGSKSVFSWIKYLLTELSKYILWYEVYVSASL